MHGSLEFCCFCSFAVQIEDKCWLALWKDHRKLVESSGYFQDNMVFYIICFFWLVVCNCWLLQRLSVTQPHLYATCLRLPLKCKHGWRPRTQKCSQGIVRWMFRCETWTSIWRPCWVVQPSDTSNVDFHHLGLWQSRQRHLNTSSSRQEMCRIFRNFLGCLTSPKYHPSWFQNIKMEMERLQPLSMVKTWEKLMLLGKCWSCRFKMTSRFTIAIFKKSRILFMIIHQTHWYPVEYSNFPGSFNLPFPIDDWFQLRETWMGQQTSSISASILVHDFF